MESPLKNPFFSGDAAPVVGHLVQLTDGRAVVDYPGNTSGPVAAKTIITLPPTIAVAGQKLLLLFEENDYSRPIVVGVVNERLVSDEEHSFSSDRPGHAVVDGKKVRFDAQEEIYLVCGQSSILLRADGKVVIKGKNILSRASGANKIKGSSILCN
ncbi:uncharacterized protein conserved in bacteria [Hahella chejuensis KCTC 2396]|uniref:Uncharacterized protein conserved in bacteria n=1 Tax=Hahella chejuensis (strain KCTC 2396) TaxID=349521 RepID=Q2S6Q2_HAHCH|nr:DUF6484 domain-containing protein [Hahella chejuensis]ABC33672.1 uncharacterized protein conserved in bacteria [Hahella chejuensis KCTC 2396]